MKAHMITISPLPKLDLQN